MPKLQDTPIEKCDLIEYLRCYSDFSFELNVLKMLREYQIDCEHGGLYEDPVTGKYREFDIRANKIISNYRIWLAIECKNIKENFPVLVSCIPRHNKESYHQIAMLKDPTPEYNPHFPIVIGTLANALILRNKFSIYQQNEPVGKSTAQVGRVLHGDITANDGELYDKWSQSLSSLSDLASRMYYDGEGSKQFFFSSLFPIVVVPDGRLWQAIYDSDGNIIHEPTPSDRCSCFVEKEYRVGSKIAGTNFTISHIEIMTLDGLRKFVEQYMTDEEGIQLMFPEDGVKEAYQRKYNLNSK